VVGGVGLVTALDAAVSQAATPGASHRSNQPDETTLKKNNNTKNIIFLKIQLVECKIAARLHHIIFTLKGQRGKQTRGVPEQRDAGE